MPNYTTYFNLILPNQGELNYHTGYKNGMNLIDTYIGESEIIKDRFYNTNGFLYATGFGTFEGKSNDNSLKSPVAGVGTSSPQLINSTTYVDVTGSSVTYTPATGSTKVIYIYYFHLAGTLSPNQIMIDFLIDGVSQSNCKHDVYTVSTNSRPIFLLFVSNAWTGSKVMKLQARMNTTGYDVNLNQTYRYNGVVSPVNVNSYYMVTSL
jgi:hypothetical protein